MRTEIGHDESLECQLGWQRIMAAVAAQFCYSVIHSRFFVEAANKKLDSNTQWFWDSS